MSVLLHIRLIFSYLIGLFWLSLVCVQVLRLSITKRSKFFRKKNRTSPPKCLQDRQYGTHQTVQLRHEAVKLHYVESGPADGQLMVMLHGFPEFWYSWRHQIRHFKKTYRVVAVDLRGYGESSKPGSVSAYKVAALRDDIKELIQLLSPKRRCIVLGHDWGGAITWSLGGHYPELFEKIIIMNCPHPAAMMKYMQSSWKQFMKSWYMFLVNLPYFPEWFFGTGDLHMLNNTFRGKVMGLKKGEFTDEDLEAFKYTFNRNSDFTGPMNYIRASVRGLNKTRDLGGKIQGVPVLLVWGTRDGALNTEMSELSRAYANDFRLVLVEGASHWVQQDEPDIVNGYVQEFLAE